MTTLPSQLRRTASAPVPAVRIILATMLSTLAACSAAHRDGAANGGGTVSRTTDVAVGLPDRQKLGPGISGVDTLLNA